MKKNYVRFNMNYTAKSIKALSECCDSPGEFIAILMFLKGETEESLAAKKGCKSVYINQVKNNKVGISPAMCLELSEILGIDPYILNRLNADYRLKLVQENKKQQEI